MCELMRDGEANTASIPLVVVIDDVPCRALLVRPEHSVEARKLAAHDLPDRSALVRETSRAKALTSTGKRSSRRSARTAERHGGRAADAGEVGRGLAGRHHLRETRGPRPRHPRGGGHPHQQVGGYKNDVPCSQEGQVVPARLFLKRDEDVAHFFEADWRHFYSQTEACRKGRSAFRAGPLTSCELGRALLSGLVSKRSSCGGMILV